MKLITMQLDITLRTTRSTINSIVHVPDLLLNVAKMHLPIEVPFYGMCFQNVNRSIFLTMYHTTRSRMNAIFMLC